MARRHLLIDLDGVIRQWTDNDSLPLPISAHHIRTVAFEESLLSQVITGHLSDEEWREEVARRLSERFAPTDCQEAVAVWSESPGHVNQAIVEILQTNAGDITLITNATSRLSRDLQVLNLNGLFRHIVNSSEIGFAKPDERIFHHALALNSCDASEALFIDDSAENVAAAEKLGIMSHVYANPEGLRDFLNHYALDK